MCVKEVRERVGEKRNNRTKTTRPKVFMTFSSSSSLSCSSFSSSVCCLNRGPLKLLRRVVLSFIPWKRSKRRTRKRKRRRWRRRSETPAGSHFRSGGSFSIQQGRLFIYIYILSSLSPHVPRPGQTCTRHSRERERENQKPAHTHTQHKPTHSLGEKEKKRNRW